MYLVSAGCITHQGTGSTFCLVMGFFFFLPCIQILCILEIIVYTGEYLSNGKSCWSERRLFLLGEAWRSFVLYDERGHLFKHNLNQTFVVSWDDLLGELAVQQLPKHSLNYCLGFSPQGLTVQTCWGGGTLGWILRSCHCFLGRVYFGKPTFGIYGWTGKAGWRLFSAVGVGRWWRLYLQSTLCLEKLSWIFCSWKRRLMWDQVSHIRMNKQIYPNYRLWIQCVIIFLSILCDFSHGLACCDIYRRGKFYLFNISRNIRF